MLEFILGRAGSGKSTYLMKQIREDTRAGKRVLLLVPEQFTFETERNYYDFLGAGALKHLQVTSFTRFAHHIFKEFGGTAGDYADDSKKLILMNLALQEVAGELSVYGKQVKNTSFSEHMLQLIGELKNADLSDLEFEEKASQMPQGRLKEKSKDIALIYSTYEAFLSQGYKDGLDDLSKAEEKIKVHDYLRNTKVYLDEFKGFTAREFAFLRTVLIQAESVTVSLCMDAEEQGDHSLFYCVRRTYEGLKRLARDVGVAVAAPVKLQGSHRFTSPALAHLEKNVFQNRILPLEQDAEGVQFYLALNEYKEADLVAAKIRDLVEKKGYRYREIVVVSRDLELYRDCIEMSFEKYEIPYYLDARKDITTNPLIRLADLSFVCAEQGFSSQKILSLLKCGLSPFTYEEISYLENYVYLWEIEKQGWMQEFTYSIYGVNPPRNEQEEIEQKERLLLLNRMRTYVVEHLGAFRRKVSPGREQTVSGYEMSKALLELFADFQIQEHLQEWLNLLSEETSGEAVAVQSEYRRVWELIGESARLLAQTLGKRRISVKRYRELFLLVVKHFDLGTIPQTLDSVTVGSAERIRTDEPKAVFILGVNDKVFPYFPAGGGIYTDQEREILSEQGLELSKPVKEQIKEERFVAYKMMTAPSRLLVLSARKGDLKGMTCAPSYLLGQVKRMFPENAVIETENLEDLYFCRSKQTAFSVLAEHFREDTPLTASLKAYFRQEEAYASRIDMLYRSLGKGKFKIEDKAVARALFGNHITLSPTGIEQYHRCKFRYFCEQELRLRPRERVKLNPLNRGTIVHQVLYQVCSRITDFTCFAEEEIKKLIQEAVDETVELLGGYDRQNKRFLYLYQRIQESVFALIKRLFDELSHSQFKPTDFEYEIGRTGNVKPYRFTSKEGVTIYIQGTVDRIDSYEDENGEKYIRVIDYKTGTKEFRLSDLINGLNLQMFLYLMCLERNGVGKYQNITKAGALYLPAGESEGQLGRYATEAEQQENVDSHYKMKGIILDRDRVVMAMEPDLAGVYTPLSIKKKGYDKDNRIREDVFLEHRANEELFEAASLESLLTDEQLNLLFAAMEDSLGEMVAELCDGNIEAKPMTGTQLDSCAYCHYRAVCGFEEGDPVNEYRSLKKKEIFELLRKEEQDG